MTYDLVSQGILLYSTEDKEAALLEARKSNKKWLKYRQKCIDAGEDYANNAIEVYENGILIENEWGVVKAKQQEKDLEEIALE